MRRARRRKGLWFVEGHECLLLFDEPILTSEPPKILDIGLPHVADAEAFIFSKPKTRLIVQPDSALMIADVGRLGFDGGSHLQTLSFQAAACFPGGRGWVDHCRSTGSAGDGLALPPETLDSGMDSMTGETGLFDPF